MGSDRAFRLGLLQKGWVNESMFSFYPALSLPKRPPKQAKQLFVELFGPMETHCISRKSLAALLALQIALVSEFGKRRR